MKVSLISIFFLVFVASTTNAGIAKIKFYEDDDDCLGVDEDDVEEGEELKRLDCDDVAEWEYKGDLTLEYDESGLCLEAGDEDDPPTLEECDSDEEKQLWYFIVVQGEEDAYRIFNEEDDLFIESTGDEDLEMKDDQPDDEDQYWRMEGPDDEFFDP